MTKRPKRSPSPSPHSLKRIGARSRSRTSPPGRGGNIGGVPWGIVEHDGYVYRDEDAIESSRLLAASSPSNVEFRDAVYEVEVKREQFHETIYRPDVDPVADSPWKMEAILRAALLDARIPPEALSPEERDILERAANDEYRESTPYSGTFKSVLEYLDQWAYIDGNVEKDAGVETGLQRRFLRYDDRYVTFTLRFDTET